MNREQREELFGHKAYDAHRKFFPENPPWEELPMTTQEAWKASALAAVQSFPAPVVLEVAFSAGVGHYGQPVKRVFLADATKESIAVLTQDLQQWLEHWVLSQ